MTTSESMGKVLRLRAERMNLPERKGNCLSNSLPTFLVFFDIESFTFNEAILNRPCVDRDEDLVCDDEEFSVIDSKKIQEKINRFFSKDKKKSAHTTRLQLLVCLLPHVRRCSCRCCVRPVLCDNWQLGQHIF